MSGHRDRHIARSGVVPQAPPPPVLRGTGRSGRRSRSRSRSPRRSRHSLPAHHEPLSRQKSEGDRGRGNRRSRSPFPSGSNPHVNMDPFNRLNHHTVLPSSVPVALPQSISLITSEGGIIRRILNADEVKIPRRLGEGARPIFERDELKEALLRRYATDEDGLNTGASTSVPQPTTQRVIAIIREPGPGEMILDPYRNNHDNPSSSFREGGARNDSRRQQQRPNSPHLRASSNISSKRSLSPPTRDRDARDSKIGRSRQLPLERNHAVEVRGRERAPSERIHVADKHRFKERSDRLSKTRPIDRSPVRILRDRPERHSRSRSHTPPPMPPQIRRQMIERARDLRNKLSRPAKILNKFDSAHDYRGEGSSSFRGGRGGFRGRGGGSFRPREENSSSRGNWEHDKFLENDMYEWEKSDGDKN